MPCSEKRARLLLSRGLAVVHRTYPFAIRLKQRVGGDVQPVQVKLDPGSKTTGIALVVLLKDRIKTLNLFHLQHRGQAIKDSLEARSAMRRRRRNQLWYRPARFDNRVKPDGWLPPSLQHRVDTTVSLVNKLSRLAPVDEIVAEQVKFDMQLMEQPEIAGKEYLLEKHNRTCVYCGGVSGASGNFNITTSTDTVQGISHKYCILISRNDGYGYSLTQQQGGAIPPTTSASGKLGYPRER